MVAPFDAADAGAARAWERLPEEIRDDWAVRTMFEEMFTPGGDGFDNWQEAHHAWDALSGYVMDVYGMNIEDLIDWDDWRSNYDAHVG
jgi:hypothetical protein